MKRTKKTQCALGVLLAAGVFILSGCSVSSSKPLLAGETTGMEMLQRNTSFAAGEDSAANMEENAPDSDPSVKEEGESDLSYEKITELMCGAVSGSPTIRSGDIFSYNMYYGISGVGEYAELNVKAETLSGKLELPQYVNADDKAYPITSVDFQTKDMSEVTDIVFPEYIFDVGYRSKLEQSAWFKALPDGPVYIGKAFYGYKGEMPEDYDLIIKEGIKVIMADALKECENLRTIYLPDSVIYIGHYAFSGCISLCKIRMSRNLMYFGSFNISECQALNSIFIPSTRIDKNSKVFELGIKRDFTVYFEETEDELAITENELGDCDAVYGCSFEKYESSLPSEVDTMTGLAHLADIPVGGIVKFGSYEQDNNLENGPESIRWNVYAKEGEWAVLLSESILDAVPYYAGEYRFSEESEVVNDREFQTKLSHNGWYTELIVTWDKSDLRTWLNEEFYNMAFTEEEKEAIGTNLTVTPARKGYTNGCPDTEDKVFILSYPEIYDNMELSRAKYTDYAAEKTADEHFDCYWLRSNMAEESDKDASEIEVFNSYHDKAEDAEEDSFKLYNNRGVRPAVRVRIP